MLKLTFFNVNEGDSLLIEEGGFRMLVDTGKAETGAGWPSLTCLEQLERLGVKRLDRVLITHLHLDHMGGLQALAGRIAIGEVLSGYWPPRAGVKIPQRPEAPKTLRGLIKHLNAFGGAMDALERAGTRLSAAESARGISLTDSLRADIIVPDPAMSARQKLAWDSLYTPRSAPERELVETAKARNPNSIRMRLSFAGRVAEISADCYGEVWAHEAQPPCDIWKVPHHGDIKSITPEIVRRLQPHYCVISCGRDYVERKDRPSGFAIGLLRDAGARVWYTDAFDDGRTPVRRAPSLTFTIDEEGNITPPDEVEERGTT